MVAFRLSQSSIPDLRTCSSKSPSTSFADLDGCGPRNIVAPTLADDRLSMPPRSSISSSVPNRMESTAQPSIVQNHQSMTTPSMASFPRLALAPDRSDSPLNRDHDVDITHASSMGASPPLADHAPESPTDSAPHAPRAPTALPTRTRPAHPARLALFAPLCPLPLASFAGRLETLFRPVPAANGALPLDVVRTKRTMPFGSAKASRFALLATDACFSRDGAGGSRGAVSNGLCHVSAKTAGIRLICCKPDHVATVAAHGTPTGTCAVVARIRQVPTHIATQYYGTGQFYLLEAQRATLDVIGVKVASAQATEASPGTDPVPPAAPPPPRPYTQDDNWVTVAAFHFTEPAPDRPSRVLAAFDWPSPFVIATMSESARELLAASVVSARGHRRNPGSARTASTASVGPDGALRAPRSAPRGPSTVGAGSAYGYPYGPGSVGGSSVGRGLVVASPMTPVPLALTPQLLEAVPSPHGAMGYHAAGHALPPLPSHAPAHAQVVSVATVPFSPPLSPSVGGFRSAARNVDAPNMPSPPASSVGVRPAIRSAVPAASVAGETAPTEAADETAVRRVRRNPLQYALLPDHVSSTPSIGHTDLMGVAATSLSKVPLRALVAAGIAATAAEGGIHVINGGTAYVDGVALITSQSPIWNEESRMYELSLGARVEQASVKNTQLSVAPRALPVAPPELQKEASFAEWLAAAASAGISVARTGPPSIAQSDIQPSTCIPPFPSAAVAASSTTAAGDVPDPVAAANVFRLPLRTPYVAITLGKCTSTRFALDVAAPMSPIIVRSVITAAPRVKLDRSPSRAPRADAPTLHTPPPHPRPSPLPSACSTCLKRTAASRTRPPRPLRSAAIFTSSHRAPPPSCSVAVGPTLQLLPSARTSRCMYAHPVVCTHTSGASPHRPLRTPCVWLRSAA